MAASAESNLLRKYYSNLRQALLHPSVVAGQLYGRSIIDATTRDKIAHSPSEGAAIIVSAIEAYFSCSFDDEERRKDFLEMLDLLREHTPLNKVVDRLKAEYDAEKTEIQTPSRLSSLKIALRVYCSDLDKSYVDSSATLLLVKSNVKDYIEKCLDEGVDTATVKKDLIELNRDALIPEDVTDWCYDQLEELSDKLKIMKRSPPVVKATETHAETPSLFSKESVYHASLGAYVACTSHKSSNVCEILASEGHKFKEMSLSRTNRQKIFLAMKDDGIVYIAFEGENDLSEWLKYPSVVKGLERQTMSIPLRYFFELLRQGKRLIFTGFSFGGLLASYVTGQLWKLPLVSAQSLIKNVACIMFGAPLTPIKSVEAIVKESPMILQSLNSFYLKDDHIPKLLRFLDVAIFDRQINMPNKPRETLLPNVILQHLLTIQSSCEIEKKDLAINSLKKVLKEALKSTDIMQKEIGAQTGSNTYMISQSDYQGLNCAKLYDPEQELIYISARNIEGLTVDLFAKHNMDIYRQKILRGYLDKDPIYILPHEKPLESVTAVRSLKPSVADIELFSHEHPKGKELAVVITGDNLWFTQAIEIEFRDFSEKIEVTITAENVSQKQIECRHLLNEHSDLYEHLAGDLHVKVSVESQFATLVPKSIKATLKNIDPISFRQSQLAKQTPSQIIILAFLSALLEQPPPGDTGSRPSKRYAFISKFFQEAARIVPMESIFFAIANCSSDDTALKCADALIQNIQPSQIPVSTLTVDGCDQATERLRSIVMNEAWSGQLQFWQPSAHQSRHMLYSEAAASTSTMRLSQPINNLPPKATVLVRIFDEINSELQKRSHVKRAKGQLNIVSGRNIGEVYPISKALAQTTSTGSGKVSALAPLPDILKVARNMLRILAASQTPEIGCVSSNNSQMLQCVNSIIENNLKPCVTMLGGFMEQQIRLPLVDNPFDTALALEAAHDSEAVGVWALFALKSEDILKLLSTSKNQSLVVQVAKYIQGILNRQTGEQPDPKQDMNYAGKLQFLIAGAMNRTVTCSSQYISYSLERELVSLCKRLKISTATKVESLLTTWDDKFKNTALYLVPEIHRPLLARWLIWALSIHRLRNGLAGYTTIGVIGLVNSGKSTLVKKLFTTRAVAGTTQSARTTVPLIYNMEDAVDGLSIIDFPGVDDRDDSIPQLAGILVGLAQVVIFLCSYDRFHTKSAGDWMQHLKEFSSIPVLVCLTHADKLYEETFKDAIPKCPPDKIDTIRGLVKQELKKIVGPDMFYYSESSLCNIRLCSLLQNEYSPMNSPEGRESMNAVGILTPKMIGKWIQDMLNSHLKQPELAESLHAFLKN